MARYRKISVGLSKFKKKKKKKRTTKAGIQSTFFVVAKKY
jgi:hypothetical protein